MLIDVARNAPVLQLLSEVSISYIPSVTTHGNMNLNKTVNSDQSVSFPPFRCVENHVHPCHEYKVQPQPWNSSWNIRK